MLYRCVFLFYEKKQLKFREGNTTEFELWPAHDSQSSGFAPTLIS
jgi:hypothetical protein